MTYGLEKNGRCRKRWKKMRENHFILLESTENCHKIEGIFQTKVFWIFQQETIVNHGKL